MHELSNKYKEYAKDSQESKTIIKILMKTNSQNNAITYTLTNIMNIDEKPIKKER